MKLCPVVLWLCAAACARPQTASKIAEQSWHSATTPHVTLETDLETRYVAGRAEVLEREYQTLIELYAMLSPRVPQGFAPMRVVLFTQCESLSWLADGSWAWFSGSSSDLQSAPETVICDNLSTEQVVALEERNAAFRGQIAIALTKQFFGHVPNWLLRGISAYFEGTRFTSNEVELGHPPRAWDHQDVGAMIPFASVRNQIASSNGKHEASFWRMAHAMLNTSEQTRTQTVAYLADLTNGVAERDAWTKHMSALEPAIRKTYETWKPLAKYNTWRIRRKQTAVEAPTVRPMTKADVAARLVALAISHADPPTRAAKVSTAIDNLTRVSPERTLLWQAIAAHYDPKANQADTKALFEQYVAKAPQDALGQLGLFLAATAVDESKEALLAIEPTVNAAIPLVSSAHLLAQVGWYWMGVDKYEIAQPFFVRAIEKDATCAYCYSNLALIRFHNKQFDQAIAMLEKAIILSAQTNNGTPDAKLVERLGNWRTQATPAK